MDRRRGRVVLEPGALREPQWNVNANQLGYGLAGTVLVPILVPILGNASWVRRRVRG
ncbi:cupin domain-containing protein [Nonomuraea fuscirosea]|uniref:cupin domain-containing protein n=1 Tax=Nonomuraea fuscirosea TaxID=1291556 RepID=UPI0033BFB968